MIQPRMTIRLAILFFLVGTSMAWSKRMHKPRPSEDRNPHMATAESKVEPHYSGDPKSSYILDEDHYPKADGSAEEYVESEDQTSVKEQNEAQGNEDLDDTIKNDEYDDHSEKGDHKQFKAGGASFDKHFKDHKADNKELENVKQHDMGEKFGGESTKEHKLGKHKEKSKGHKLHGFKNVYHKEEYGDHKTFHDEFLDTDHQHNYDDHHEHQELHGGKFSKGFKHEGKNDKFDKGDEKHEWGKEDYDANHEGKYDKGGQNSKHRHAVKKHQGHFDADAQRQKNSVHKVNKGMPPLYPSHGGHHGPHQAQIQPYVPHYNPHHEHIDVPPLSHSPHPQKAPYTPQDENAYSSGHHGNHLHNDNGHGIHHSSHTGQHINDQSGEHYPKGDSYEGDYHGRTAQNQQRRLKNDQSGKNEEKFVPVIKHETVPHNHEAKVHSHKSHVHSHEPRVHKHESVMRVHDPIAQKHENHPHNHHHHSHTHKQSVSPHHGLQQYRQPVLLQNSPIQQSPPLTQEKITERLTRRPHNHEDRIKYGFQPRNHGHHHNHNSRFHRNHNSHHHHHRQPFPRFSDLHHNNQAHSQHHHNPHSHLRQKPNNYQQEVQHVQPQSQAPAPKAEYYANKPSRSEEQPASSQMHYE